MLLGVLHCIPDQDDPAAIVARLLAAVPAGSYLAIAHPASDIATDQMAQSMGRHNQQARDPVTARTHAEVCRFFTGLDLIEPGVVQLHRWRADTGDPGNGRELANYGGVAARSPPPALPAATPITAVRPRVRGCDSSLTGRSALSLAAPQ